MAVVDREGKERERGVEQSEAVRKLFEDREHAIAQIKHFCTHIQDNVKSST